MRALAFIPRISKIQIAATTLLCAISPVCYGSSSLCIKSESQLKEVIAPYKVRYKEALDCVSKIENKIPCPDFSALVQKGKEEYLELTKLFEETKCVDFLILGLNEYDLYYNHSVRSLSDYPAITAEYDRASALAEATCSSCTASCTAPARTSPNDASPAGPIAMGRAASSGRENGATGSTRMVTARSSARRPGRG